ncbi:hypothetical protein MTQ10_05325 [Streptomyces sp. XM83C]|jgi:hypothetical protein|uniref:Uncharacterized protein n=1 Tax=Streptomyces thermocoprophilus TaxID=78356 RepID=A0ABV5VMB9_9ACTN|nr:hypothetical protein [Streptomyces sp. XM83C]MCK1819044.1 hypothetical protein [Streptomyces sp. XM83C]
MSPDSMPSGSVRSAAELNERIRALWLRTGGRLTDREREQYEALVVEWAEAVRGGVVEAA